MALNFLAQIPEWMMLQIRKGWKQRELQKRVNRASKMIDQMPEWQKKDLNVQANDLRSYRHHM